MRPGACPSTEEGASMLLMIRPAVLVAVLSAAVVHPAYSQPAAESAQDSQSIQIEPCTEINREDAHDMTTSIWRLRLMDQIDCLQRQNRELSNIVDALLTEPRVQSGVIVVNDSEALESGLARPPSNGDCSLLRGLSGARVDFEHPFVSTPEVLVSLTQIDQGTRGSVVTRLVVTATDARGFNYDLHTWCDSRVARVRAEWIAVAKLPSRQ